MSKQGLKYQPSNGTEGMMFIERFCDQCRHHDPTEQETETCEILGKTMCHSPSDPEYPSEWTYDKEDRPTCTKFEKWDWNGGDDGEYTPPQPRPVTPPNQLDMFPFTQNGEQEHVFVEKYAFE